ncbi:hypothetical protein EKO04_003285 [Ascochyta lentis]|uniref:FAD-binding domain-containing protein n=1 Tax=Ascochyta lentis TaxID=205686 RepID=A0A8H7J8B5_9PLEO|nr:hypothetical protein EKO04_003285 [Ascochyta lentis]
MSSPPRHAKVLIAGGSIAGLTLANALEQRGVDYLLLEKHPHVAPDIGASLCIFPNGFEILHQLGCYDRINALAEDANSFGSVTMRNRHSHAIVQAPRASQQIKQRMGYAPMFLERRVIIQALYDNIKEKHKFRTSKGVVKVVFIPNGVQVRTDDGSLFTGEILVGADGIHSTVRGEMWRLANEQQPDHFPSQQCAHVPTSYCCMFGITDPGEGFPKSQTQHVQGQHHSYLLSTGPKNCVYWFLFKQLPAPTHRLHTIPRYSSAERDGLAEHHAADPLTETLCFGQLYRMRRTATLQTLPEVIFSRWHYDRIMTIGDAAHKLNPISGQGGNSAIEDAACLANQIHLLTQPGHEQNTWTDSDFVAAFTTTQQIRHGRVKRLLRKSHYMQRVQAMDSRVMSMVAQYAMPLVSGNRIVEALCNDARGAVRLEAQGDKATPHPTSYDDKRRSSRLGLPWVVCLICALFLALVHYTTMNVRHA